MMEKKNRTHKIKKSKSATQYYIIWGMTPITIFIVFLWKLNRKCSTGLGCLSKVSLSMEMQERPSISNIWPFLLSCHLIK